MLYNVFYQSSDFPCHYHSNVAPHYFKNLPNILFRIFLPVHLFPCQYHSTISPNSFNHLSHMLYTFFSQCFSIPLSVTYPHCSIHINPPATHTLKYILSVLQISPVSIFPPFLYTHSNIKYSCCKFFLSGLQFSPLSSIPLLLHTYSTTYQPGCIVFSQCFRFPLSVTYPNYYVSFHYIQPTL